MELAVALAILSYFLPTIIAFVRGHNSKWGILLVNLFLGVTGIFWFLALVWAASSSTGNQTIVVNNNQQVGK